jgi:hypothetical protein
MKYTLLFCLIIIFKVSFSQSIVRSTGSMSQMGKENFKA